MRTPTAARWNTTLPDDAQDVDEAFSTSLLEVDGVAGLTQMSSMRSSLDDTIASINYVVYVIILCAGMLAFVVLYNLTNINITERVREIATIKVLGFYDREVDAYIFRENIILTIAGTAVGTFLGILLHQFVKRILFHPERDCDKRHAVYRNVLVHCQDIDAKPRQRRKNLGKHARII